MVIASIATVATDAIIAGTASIMAIIVSAASVLTQYCLDTGLGSRVMKGGGGWGACVLL